MVEFETPITTIVCVALVMMLAAVSWRIGWDQATSHQVQRHLEQKREVSKICDYIESLRAGTDEELGSNAHDRKSLCVGATPLKRWGEEQ